MFSYALVTIFHSNTSRRPGRRRGRFAQAAAARRNRAPTVRRYLFVSAAGPEDCPEGHADPAGRDEPHRWAGILSAGVTSGRIVAGIGTLERDQRRYVPSQRTQRRAHRYE